MRRRYDAIGLVILASLLVYAPLLMADFAWDDEVLVPALAERGLGGLSWLSRGLWPEQLAAVNGLPVYRPLMELDLQLLLAVFGVEPVAFHAVSVGLMLGVGGLVWALAVRLLAICGCPEERRATLGALVAGLVLLHPAHQEAVAFVAARNDLWAAAAVLGSALLWQGRRWYLAPPLVLVGLLFKEITIVALGLLPALDLLELGHHALARRWRRWLLLGLALAGWLVLRFGVSDLPGGGLSLPPLWAWVAGFCHSGAVLLGARAPSPHQPLSLVLSTPGWWLPGAVCGVAVILALGRSLVGLGGLVTWWLVAAAALLFAVPTDNYGDRYLFLADIGLALGATCVMARVSWARWQQGMAVGLLVALAVLNASSISRWANSAALWGSAAQHDPTGYSSYQFGLVLQALGREDDARVALEAALAAPLPELDAAIPLGLSRVWGGDLEGGCSLLESIPARQPELRAKQAATLCFCARSRGRLTEAAAALQPGLSVGATVPLVVLERFALAAQLEDESLMDEARAGLLAIGLSEERGRLWIEYAAQLNAKPAPGAD